MATNDDSPESALHVAEIALGINDLDTAEDAILEALSRVRKTRRAKTDGGGS